MARRNQFDSIKIHAVRDKRYRILWRRPPTGGKSAKKKITRGCCDPPTIKDRLIYISPESGPVDDLVFAMTTIHELLHAACFDLDENAVEEYEASVYRLFIRMGVEIRFHGPGKRPKFKGK